MQSMEETSNISKVNRETHKRHAEKHKTWFEKKLAQARNEKGLLIVYTGNGKGKSTAAFGMGLRVLGHGMKLGVVQFIKGALETGERNLLEKLPNCDFYTIGDGYTWNTQNLEADIKTADKAWQQAKSMIADLSYNMIILDELNVVLKHNYLPLQKVTDVLASRPPMLHIVVTGRNAPPQLIEQADLVSEIQPVKHPYREQGIKAQKGVEF